jgi:2-oxoglutarate dehydrogenase E2 component (dihydrolipoamide succinyltransferase)
MIDIKVPPVGESISEVTLIKWTKPDGQWVERDEILCELESEKATFELNAEQAGILKQVAKEGDTLHIGDLACSIDDKAERPAELPQQAIKETPSPEVTSQPQPNTLNFCS